MSQRESPKTEVGGCVRDCTEGELDGLDHLMDEKITESVVVVFNFSFHSETSPDHPTDIERKLSFLVLRLKKRGVDTVT